MFFVKVIKSVVGRSFCVFFLNVFVFLFVVCFLNRLVIIVEVIFK